MAGRRSSAAMRKADPGTWVKISCGVVSAPCRMEVLVTPSRPIIPTSIRRPSGVLATTEMMASSGKTTCWMGLFGSMIREHAKSWGAEGVRLLGSGLTGRGWAGAETGVAGEAGGGAAARRDDRD